MNSNIRLYQKEGMMFDWLTDWLTELVSDLLHNTTDVHRRNKENKADWVSSFLTAHQRL